MILASVSNSNVIKTNERGSAMSMIPYYSQKRSFLGVAGRVGGVSQSQLRCQNKEQRLPSTKKSWPSWRSSSLVSSSPSFSLLPPPPSPPSPPPLPPSRTRHQADVHHKDMLKHRAVCRRTTVITSASHDTSDPDLHRCLSGQELRRCKALESSWEDAFREAKPEVWNQHYCFGESGRQTMVSETSAFASMGLRPEDMLLSETAMQTQMHPLPLGIKTPEGVFRSSDDSWLRNALPGSSRIAIEVKRIAFHRIPDTMPGKYKNLYLRLGGWYAELVQEAVDQISPAMASFFDIDGHVVFVAVPESMSPREVEQIRAELLDRIDLHSCAVQCVLTVQRVPDTAFARKLLSHLRA